MQHGSSNDELEALRTKFKNIEPKQPRRQGRYWFGTIPHQNFTPYLPPGVTWIKGQLEKGENTGYYHWQFVCAFEKKVSIRGFREVFGQGMHGELTISEEGSEEYVWKDETCVDPSTRFELGKRKLKRNSRTDWQSVREQAIAGDLASIAADLYIRHYRSLRQISIDHLRSSIVERRAYVFWGESGSGKTHTAWELCGIENTYPKSPDEKWWDSYQDQKNVIVDEFRGGIGISRLLQWTDKFPFLVETKGGHRKVQYTRIVFTSNLHPTEWYPNLDGPTYQALLRRLTIIQFPRTDNTLIFD